MIRGLYFTHQFNIFDILVILVLYSEYIATPP